MIVDLSRTLLAVSSTMSSISIAAYSITVSIYNQRRKEENVEASHNEKERSYSIKEKSILWSINKNLRFLKLAIYSFLFAVFISLFGFLLAALTENIISEALLYLEVVSFIAGLSLLVFTISDLEIAKQEEEAGPSVE